MQPSSRIPTPWRPHALAAALALILPISASAGDLTEQEPTVIEVRLGSASGEERFEPNRLTLEAGKMYILRLVNPTQKSYYFNSSRLADAVYTRKVSFFDASGQPAGDAYGTMRRIEVKGGRSAEWWLLPVRTGVFEDLMSRRTEPDMKGTVEIR